MDQSNYDPHELDRQWAARLAWELNVPEPNLAKLDGPVETWRQAGEPLVSAADAVELEEWFLL
jgi:hypothetical protein